MEGRRLIVLMVAGAMSQYFAKVQGMPKQVESRLQKRIKHFLWAEREKVRINEATIMASKEQGGQNLLDIAARNKAIAIMWLKSYLNFGVDRPMWAFVANRLIASASTAKEKNIDDDIKINLFLQTWNTKKQSLPDDLENMISIATKYRVRLEGRAFARNILRQMPIWFHIQSNEIRKYNHGRESHCLRANHKIKTVGKMENLALCLQDPNHKNRRDCRCENCKSARDIVGCKNPHKCFVRAHKLLACLPDKWNPMKAQPEDYENIENNAGGLNIARNVQIFNHRISITGSLSDAFRIFTDGDVCNETPQISWNPPGIDTTQIQVFTDGSCTNNGDENAKAGAGIFIAKNDSRNRDIRILNELEQTNQTGEIIAIKEAAEILDKNSELLIVSDSETTINAAIKNRHRFEDRGWIGIKNNLELQVMISRLLECNTKTSLKWIKGHSGITGNEEADKAAERGSKKIDGSDMIDLTIPSPLRLTGIKLNKITQSLAYKAIRIQKTEKTRYQQDLD